MEVFIPLSGLRAGTEGEVPVGKPPRRKGGQNSRQGSRQLTRAVSYRPDGITVIGSWQPDNTLFANTEDRCNSIGADVTENPFRIYTMSEGKTQAFNH